MARSTFPNPPPRCRLSDKSCTRGRKRESAGGTDQAAVVFGDGGGQVVIGNLARHAAQRRKRMHVTTDEGFEALAVGKLQVQHAAVRFDQGEGVELALVPRII